MDLRFWVKKESKQLKNTDNQQLTSVYTPPLSWDTLRDYYGMEGYHAQALRTKAASVVGGGLDDTFAKWLEDSTPTISTGELLKFTALDFEIFGNAYWEVRPVDNGLEVYYMPANTMYRAADHWQQKVKEKTQRFELEEVFHFRNYSLYSSWYGDIEYRPLLKILYHVKRIFEYNAVFFDNNGTPDYLMCTKGADLSQKAVNRLNDFFKLTTKGWKNAHKLVHVPLPPDTDITFQQLNYQREGSFLGDLDTCVAHIISGHGVPPQLMGVQVPGKLGNDSQDAMDVYMKNFVIPRQEFFNSRLRRFCLDYSLNFEPELQKIEYNFNASRAVQDFLKA